MAKIVKYNGRESTYSKCSSPKNLVSGRHYEVIKTISRDAQLFYVLNGVDGFFYADWFDIPSVYIAISHQLPVVGERLICYLINYTSNGKPKLAKIRTSAVQEISCFGSGVYQVITKHSVYLVHVN